MGTSKDTVISSIKPREIRFAMLVVNVIAFLFVTFTVSLTTRNVCAGYSSREFINTLQAFPSNPEVFSNAGIILSIFLFISFVVRENLYPESTEIIYTTLIADFIIGILIIVFTNVNYNGILFYLFANVVAYLKGQRGKYVMIFTAFISFLVTDSQILSLRYRLYDINDYFEYYDQNIQRYLHTSLNILVSLNIILFIIYCILFIQQQKGTIEEINMLNEEIKKANADLHNANKQLEEYAKITERMGETRERNRLAREIHDTLGHTLTGISCGIDACIATVEMAPEATKAHLEKISQAARNGLLEIRRSVSELKPDALERLSLEAAITKMITDMKEVADVEIYFDCKISPLKFDEDEEGAIYRVIQESLTNAIRHGKASRVWIVMEKTDGYINLTIKDDGIGCKEIKSGFGTKHITERIEMLNGSVEFKSDKGFCVIARIPIRWGEEYD